MEISQEEKQIVKTTHQPPQKAPKKFTKYFIITLIAILLLSCIGVGSYFLLKPKNDRKQLYTQEEIQTSLKNNEVKRNFQENTVYSYQLKLVQESFSVEESLFNAAKDADPKRILQEVFEPLRELDEDYQNSSNNQTVGGFSGFEPTKFEDLYNVDLVCVNITDSHVNFYLMIKNYTQTRLTGCNPSEGQKCTTYHQGYPEILEDYDIFPKDEEARRRFLKEGHNYQRFLNQDDYQQGEQTKQDQDQEYDETLEEQFFQEDENIKYGIHNSQQYIYSQIPLFYFSLDIKEGTIDDFVRPALLENQYMLNLFPILKQIFPILNQQENDKEASNRDNILNQGDFETKFSQEISEEQVQASVNSNYNQEQIVENGNLQSQKNFEQHTTASIQNGELLESAFSSLFHSKGLNETSGNENLKAIDQLMSLSASHLSKSDIQFYSEEELQNLHKTIKHIPRKEYTYEAYVQELSIVRDRISTPVLDQETLEKYQQYEDQVELEDGSIVSNSKHRLLSASTHSGNKAFPTQVIVLFEQNLFDLTTVKVNSEVDCYEPKKKTEKDYCYFTLKASLAGISLNVLPKKEFRANLRGPISTLNFLKKNVVEGILNVTNTVDAQLTQVITDVQTIRSDIDFYLDATQNPVTRPFFVIRDRVLDVVNYDFTGVLTSIFTDVQTIETTIKQTIHNSINYLQLNNNNIFYQFQYNINIYNSIFNQIKQQSQALCNNVSPDLKQKYYEARSQIDQGYYNDTLKYISKLNQLKALQTQAIKEEVKDILTSFFDKAIQEIQERRGTSTPNPNPKPSRWDTYTEKASNITDLVIPDELKEFIFTAGKDVLLNLFDIVIQEVVEASPLITRFDSLIGDIIEKRQQFTQGFGELQSCFNTINTDTVYTSNIYTRFTNNLSYAKDLSQLNWQAFESTLPQQFTQGFNTVSDTIVNIKNTITLFVSDMKSLFVEPVNEIKTEFTSMGPNIKSSFNQSVQNFYQLSNSTKDLVSETVSSFKSIVSQGNPQNQTIEEEVLDIRSIVDNVLNIKTQAQNQIDNIKATALSFTTIDESFLSFVDQITDLFTAPANAIKEVKESIDNQGIKKYVKGQPFSEAFLAGVAEQKALYDSAINTFKGDNPVDILRTGANNFINNLETYLTKDLINELNNVDDIFKSVLSQLVKSFDYELKTSLGPRIRPDLPGATFTIPVIFGYPIIIEIYGTVEAEAFFTISMKDGYVSLGVGGQAAAIVGVEGKLGVPYLLEAGVFAEGTIFQGTAEAKFLAALSDNFDARIEAWLTIEAFQFEIGLFYQTFQFEITCDFDEIKKGFNDSSNEDKAQLAQDYEDYHNDPNNEDLRRQLGWLKKKLKKLKKAIKRAADKVKKAFNEVGKFLGTLKEFAEMIIEFCDVYFGLAPERNVIWSVKFDSGLSKTIKLFEVELY